VTDAAFADSKLLVVGICRKFGIRRLQWRRSELESRRSERHALSARRKPLADGGR